MKTIPPFIITLHRQIILGGRDIFQGFFRGGGHLGHLPVFQGYIKQSNVWSFFGIAQ